MLHVMSVRRDIYNCGSVFILLSLHNTITHTLLVVNEVFLKVNEAFLKVLSNPLDGLNQRRENGLTECWRLLPNLESRV